MALRGVSSSAVIYHTDSSDDENRSSLQTPSTTLINPISSSFETPDTVLRINEFLIRRRVFFPSTPMTSDQLKEMQKEGELIQQMDEMQQFIAVFLEAGDDEVDAFSPELRYELKTIIDLFSANYFDIQNSQRTIIYQKAYDDLRVKLSQPAWLDFFTSPKEVND